MHDITRSRAGQLKVKAHGRYSRSLTAFFALLFPAAITADNLAPATLQAWEKYVEAAAGNMTQRLGPGRAFLWADEKPERLVQLRAGQVIVFPVGAQNPKRVPYGLIHDWMGAAFIPQATLKDALQVVRDYGRYKDLYRPSVTESTALEIGDSKDRFRMLLLNKPLSVKRALDTDYESCFFRVDEHRVYSISRLTRIQEVEDYGTPSQHSLSQGEGSGFIWRLFSITRYVERDGGVYIEVEALGLSRDIPSSLRWLIEPIVRRFSRASLSTSLGQTASAIRLLSEDASRAKGHGSAVALSLRAASVNQ